MATGIREREFQNLMIQWSVPMGWGFIAGRKLPRETTQTVLATQLRDAIIRLNPEVIDGSTWTRWSRKSSPPSTPSKADWYAPTNRSCTFCAGIRSFEVPTVCGTP